MSTIARAGITGIVMVGGKSRRMGRDKSTIILDGISLAERAFRKLEPWCGQVVFSGRPHCHSSSDRIFIQDIIPGNGPMGGLYSVMKTLPSPHYLVLAVDMPDVPAQLLQLLCSTDFTGIVAPRGQDGNLEPMVARYPRTIFPALEASLLAGEQAMHLFIASQDVMYLDYQAAGIHPASLRNLNYPDDLREYGKGV